MVNKLTKNVTDAHLQEIFGAFGRIHRVEMALDDKCKYHDLPFFVHD